MRRRKRLLSFLLVAALFLLTCCSAPPLVLNGKAQEAGKKGIYYDALLTWQDCSDATTVEETVPEVSSDASATTQAAATTEAPGKWVVKKGKKYYSAWSKPVLVK